MTLPVHRLGLAEFDELAAGRGGTTGQLQAGQLSKRLLQILAVLRETSVRLPRTYADGGFAVSYAGLITARRQSRSAVDAVLLRPMVGAWAAHALRRLMTSDTCRDAGGIDLDDDLGHFGSIAAAAALAAGATFDLTLRVRADGTLMLPTLGLARLDPAAKWASQWCRARYRPGSTGIDLDLPGGAVHLPVRHLDEEPMWSPLRRLTSVADGCRIELELDDLDPFRDNHGLGATDRLPAAEIAGWQDTLDEAWALLVRRHRTVATSLSGGLHTLVPLQHRDRIAELGRVAGVSATISDACGAAALTRPTDGTALAATLIHEFQHSKLTALLDLVPLHRAGTDRVFYAPWRADPRPLHGLLHGAYAHLALVAFWQEVRQPSGPQQRVAHFEFARWRRALRHALRIVDRSGLLTEAGIRFVGGMRRWVAGVSPGNVPPDADLLARDALVNHWLLWRLCNLRPDADWMATAASAWLAGRPCPPIPPNGTIAGGLAVANAGARLELAYRRLEDPHRFGDRDLLAAVPSAIAADASLVGGDAMTAARLYREAVTTAPERADWWTGLALAHRRLGTAAGRLLVARPEYVSGLHRHVRAVTGHSPDVTALAEWAAGSSP